MPEAKDSVFHTGIGSVPVPDPTEKTTQALLREISALKELVETRLDAMDKAQALFDVNLNRVPSEVDKQVGHLKELIFTKIVANSESIDKVSQTFEDKLKERDTRFLEHDKSLEISFNLVRESQNKDMDLVAEKFSGVQVQFKERDIAVQAALQAAKEAVGEQNKSNSLSITKSETATTKQIDQLGALIATTAKGSDDKIQDLKDRVTRIESFGVGGKNESEHSRSNVSIIVSIVAVVISMVFLAIAVFHNASSTAPTTAAPPVIIQQPAQVITPQNKQP